MDVGAGIRRARTQAGLSQAELAERIGSQQVVISQWETGARVPTIDNLAHLADALEVSLDVLTMRQEA